MIVTFRMQNVIDAHQKLLNAWNRVRAYCLENPEEAHAQCIEMQLFDGYKGQKHSLIENVITATVTLTDAYVDCEKSTGMKIDKIISQMRPLFERA